MLHWKWSIHWLLATDITANMYLMLLFSSILENCHFLRETGWRMKWLILNLHKSWVYDKLCLKIMSASLSVSAVHWAQCTCFSAFIFLVKRNITCIGSFVEWNATRQPTVLWYLNWCWNKTRKAKNGVKMSGNTQGLQLACLF